jgi:virulence-associated protein VapD
MNDTDKSFIVYEIQNKTKYIKKYGYEIGTTEKVNKIKNTHFRLETINKPVKSISAYKVNELIEICQKLSIDIYNNVTGKQKTKKELYELIILYF